MRARPVPAIVLMMAASAAWAFGCQLLYDKNELTVTTGGTGGSTTSTTTTGGGGTGATTSAGGTTTTTGGGGTGGATTTTAMGGTGGTTTSAGGTTTGGGGTGGATTTTGSGGDLDGGVDGDAADGADCSGDRLFVVGTSATGVLCAAFAPASGWTAAMDATGSSNERPAAAMLDGQKGVGVFFQGGATGPLRSVELTGGACSAAADVPGVTTKAAPSLAVLAGKAQTLFQGAVGAGTDHPFVAAWDAVNKWAGGAPQQIDVNVFSQLPAGLGTSGAEMLAVYGGGDDNLYRVRFAAGAWAIPALSFKDGAAVSEQANKALTPAVVGLDGGKWLVVFQEKANPTQLRWLTGDGATNVASKVIATALSAQPVSLARIPGGAVLAFRGTDGGVYATVFDAANASWGAIDRVGGAATTTPVSPAVTAGVCAHSAELVFIDAADSAVKHASLDAGMWGAAAAVGGTATKGVAIARSP